MVTYLQEKFDSMLVDLECMHAQNVKQKINISSS